MSFVLDELREYVSFEDEDLDKVPRIVLEDIVECLNTLEQDRDNAYESGFYDGEAEGGNQSYAEGHSVGYDEGYEEGHSDGYDEGYQHGYDEGFSVEE